MVFESKFTEWGEYGRIYFRLFAEIINHILHPDNVTVARSGQYDGEPLKEVSEELDAYQEDTNQGHGDRSKK